MLIVQRSQEVQGTDRKHAFMDIEDLMVGHPAMQVFGLPEMWTAPSNCGQMPSY